MNGAGHLHETLSEERLIKFAEWLADMTGFSYRPADPCIWTWNLEA